jgi:hypothetical protein
MTFGTFHKFPDGKRFGLCEVFKLNEKECAELGAFTPGWYWWERTPTTHATGKPHGPFASRRAAIGDAGCEPDLGR